MMTLTKFKPFGNLMDMNRQVNRMFGDFFDREWQQEETAAHPTWYPPTDIYETDDDYVFRLEVPGLGKEDINIELNDNTLSVKGERKEEDEVKKDDYHRVESYYGSFSRSFRLPKNVDAKKANANIKDGILELRVSKAEEAKPKAITIS